MLLALEVFECLRCLLEGEDLVHNWFDSSRVDSPDHILELLHRADEDSAEDTLADETFDGDHLGVFCASSEETDGVDPASPTDGFEGLVESTCTTDFDYVINSTAASLIGNK